MSREARMTPDSSSGVLHLGRGELPGLKVSGKGVSQRTIPIAEEAYKAIRAGMTTTSISSRRCRAARSRR